VTTIGFIGLGIMGNAMVRNLAEAGYPVIAFDRHPEKVEAVLRDGIRPGYSIADVTRQSAVIITMLPDGPNVLEVMTEEGGVLSAIRTGTIVVDMSSINPLTSKCIAEMCNNKGAFFLDAPVSGGQPKAIDGTLAIMVGGDRLNFEKVLPLFKAMGSSVTLTGEVGSGNVTKLANQIIVACNIAAMSEALVLAERCGVSPEVVFCAVREGLAGSNVLNAKAPMVVAKDFKPGFRIRLHQKDLRNAMATAESMKVALPLTSMVHQLLIASMNRGDGDLDHSALIRLIASMSSKA
jgi:2-hydroxy-3-oxopropionate reductase